MAATAGSAATILSNVPRHPNCMLRASAAQKPTKTHTSSGRHGFNLNLSSALNSLLHLNMSPVFHDDNSNNNELLLRHSGPTSPKENISAMWKQIHGSDNWIELLDPLHPWLRREIVKYGEFAQATYDAFDFDPISEFRGSCLYNKRKLFDVLGLEKNGYDVTKHLYAMSHIEMPRWLEKPLHADAWCDRSNWMGYVAVSDDEETRRIGRRDIVVAWRGTVSPTEWAEDIMAKTEKIEEGDEARVEHGFSCIYQSKCDSTWCNKSSAQEQVMSELHSLVNTYLRRGQEASVTITGHSLGGALALLTAHDVATSFPSVATTVFSFGAPMVGNAAFNSSLDRLGVKILRMASKQDVVPKLPGMFPYVHGGEELALDVAASPYLKRKFDLVGFHGLETYLHLVDGYGGKDQRRFRKEATRDVALVNKSSGMLKEELRVPECWFLPENKGMVRDANGRWVAAGRAPEDVPSPLRERYTAKVAAAAPRYG